MTAKEPTQDVICQTQQHYENGNVSAFKNDHRRNNGFVRKNPERIGGLYTARTWH